MYEDTTLEEVQAVLVGGYFGGRTTAGKILSVDALSDPEPYHY
jgi:hypothetical protein